AMKLVICWSVKEILPVKMIISYIFSDFATEPTRTYEIERKKTGHQIVNIINNFLRCIKSNC
ncbi:hypothetical protein, partial [Staphylococcus intermedius]